MKVIAVLGIIGIIMWFLISIDENTNWYGRLKFWLRKKLGLCNHFKEIVFEEEYSKEGEPFYHHTYRITRCANCGKVFKREQLQ